MFEQMHAFEITLIEKLQAIRNPVLDSVMLALDYVDSSPSWLLIILCVLFLYHHRPGVQMLFLLLLSGVLNQDLKALCAQPRPFELQPTVEMVHLTSFGFPSGAAQTVLVLFGFLALEIRKQWCWWLCSCIVLLISFSRIYLGVHFVSDVIGGWIAGVLLLTAYLYALPFIKHLIYKSSRLALYTLLFLACITLICICITPAGPPIALFGLGAGFGFLWISPLDTPKKWSVKTLRLCITVVGIGLLFWVSHLCAHIPLLLWTLSIPDGLWIGFGSIYLCRWLESLRKKRL